MTTDCVVNLHNKLNEHPIAEGVIFKLQTLFNKLAKTINTMSKIKNTPLAALDVQELSQKGQTEIKGGLLLLTCEEKRSSLTGITYEIPVLKLTRGFGLAIRM